MLSASGVTGEPQDALLREVERGAHASGSESGPGSGVGPDGVLGAPDVALLEYVTKLTRTPGGIERADVEALREVGFGDRSIHDACAIASYYAFVNRIADGLGVELEPDRDPPDGR